MPADDRFRFYDDKHVLLARPRLPQDGPEQAVYSRQRRPRSSPFKNGDLLAKSENLQGSIRAAPEVDANDGKDCKHERKHGVTVLARHHATPRRPCYACNALIPGARRFCLHTGDLWS
jgi:hypothetical protein